VVAVFGQSKSIDCSLATDTIFAQVAALAANREAKGKLARLVSDNKISQALAVGCKKVVCVLLVLVPAWSCGSCLCLMGLTCRNISR